MKKIVTSLVLLNLLVVPVIALAVVELPGVEGEGAPYVPLGKALKAVTNYLFYILIAIAAIAIIISAYYFVTATGDPEKTKKARDFVLYALIGVLVAFVAKGLVSFIGHMMGFEISW